MGDTSTSLVRPGEIEALDSKDLLDTLLSQNLSRIGDKIDERERAKWVENQTKAVKERYTKKAKTYYDQIWNRCGKSSVGHDFRRVEVKGYNTEQCNDCGYIKDPSQQRNYGGEPSLELVVKMRQDIIKVLAKRMMDLDVENGILEMPIADMYPRPLLKKGWPW